MTRTKLLLAIIGAFYFCNMDAVPFRLTKKMHNDLLTEEVSTYFNYFQTMSDNELKLSQELSNIANFTMRLETARKIHPKMYQALQKLRETAQFHMRFINNQKAANFYADYLNKIIITEAEPGSINKNYAEFIKGEIFEFNKLDKEAQEAFVLEFPEIGKIFKGIYS